MTRALLGRVLLVALGLLLGAGAAEIWLRVYPQRPGFKDDRPAYFVGPPRISPFRERPELPPKRPAVYRIIVLGDSFTWGANVQMNYTYPKLLEWLLNAARGGDFEVFNFGVNGAATADELFLLEKMAVHQPDLVLIGYFLNDPAQDPERAGEPPPRSWIRAHSRLFDLVHRRFEARQLTVSQPRYFRSLYDPEGGSWKSHRETVSTLARTAERLGIGLRVVIWPHLGFPLDERYPFRGIHQQVRALLAETRVPALDLLEVFRGHDHERLQAVPRYDPHPSEIAHRLAAEAIFDWLDETQPVAEQRKGPPGAASGSFPSDFRILFLGEFVEGDGRVLPPQTYPRHVEWLIRTACRDGAEVQTIKTGDAVEGVEGLTERPNLIVIESNRNRTVERLAAIQRESAVRTLVLRWPELDSNLSTSEPRLASTNGVTVLDLLDTFRGRDPRRLQAIPGSDARPNEIAHRLVGEAIFDWLRENEPAVARSLVAPRIHANPPHWRRWQELEEGESTPSGGRR